MPGLLRNAIRCPDGTVIESRYRHNLVEHIQEDGREYFVDGGLDYIRTGYSDDEYEDLHLYTDSPHSLIREGFSWGSYGKHGTEDKHYILLKDITDEHLEALVKYTAIDYHKHINKVLIDEQQYRGGSNEY